MKKRTYLNVIMFMILSFSPLFWRGAGGEVYAQTPQGINYQAVARNAAGNILGNTNICVQSTITNGNGGAVLYQETFNVTTNQFGLFTLNIGNGTVVSGTFATINWGAVTPWQMIEIKINCTGAYVLMGSAQLLSVPYALNAATSADNKWTLNGNDISNTNTGNVGIGIATPPANLKLNVAGRVAPDWGNNTDASYRFGDGTENSGFSSPNPNEITVISNGNESMRVTGSGNVGIGTSTPQAKLDVNGSVRINDGTQGDGKILTSDGFGTASWQTPPAGQVAFKVGLIFSNFNFDASNFARLVFDTVQINSGNGYDQSTGIFTAPSAGLYYFYVQIGWLSDFNTYGRVIIRLVNPPYQSSYNQDYDVHSFEILNVSKIYYLNTGEQVEFGAAEDASGAVEIVGFTYFTNAYGYKIF